LDILASELRRNEVGSALMSDAENVAQPNSRDLIGLVLLNFCFFKLNVLANTRIVFLEAQFFCLCTRIFLGHVEKARVCGAEQFDLNGV
jgi:hypothetical protein